MENEPHELPIDGVLDLHFFNPAEVKDLVPEYIRACREKQIYHIRIIHGKGTGTLRRLVHSILKKHPDVIQYYHGPGAGSWGATSVELRMPD